MIILSSFFETIESFFKRKIILKKFKYFLPGYGGFFDRFDSFIFFCNTFLFNVQNNMKINIFGSTGIIGKSFKIIDQSHEKST